MKWIGDLWRKNTAQKPMTICKKDDSLSHQNSIKVQYFYCKQRSKFIFRHLALKKHVKRFITEHILIVRTII